MDLVIVALAEIFQTAVDVGSGASLERVKTIWKGKPTEVNERDCDAIIIAPSDTLFDHSQSGSRYDHKIHAIDVTLLLNRKDFLGQQGTDAEKVFVEMKAAQMMEGQNTSQQVKTDTICGLVQNNQRLPYGAGLEASEYALVQNVQYDTGKEWGENFYGVTATIGVRTIGDR